MNAGDRMKSLLVRPGLPTPAGDTLDLVGAPTLQVIGAREYVHADGQGIVSFEIAGAAPPRRVILQRIAVDDWGMCQYDVEVGHIGVDLRWIVDARFDGVAGKQLGEMLEQISDLAWITR